VDQVILVGGCSQIPKFRALLQGFFGSKLVPPASESNNSTNNSSSVENKKVHPPINCEAVVFGAAMQAAILSRSRNPELTHLVSLDLVTQAIGFAPLTSSSSSSIPSSDQNTSEMMTVMIPRNSSSPLHMQSYFATTRENPSSISIDVYQGMDWFDLAFVHIPFLLFLLKIVSPVFSFSFFPCLLLAFW
jgi:L1 cell adhesion molecule like protein